MTSARHAHVVGLGLIGASLALSLREAGWRVTGNDLDPEVVTLATTSGVIEGDSPDPSVTLIAIATPAGAVIDVARDYLERFSHPDLIITDVAGVKSAIVQSISDRRFLGGHPMAGSELRGLKGARSDLFQGCTWVLTPTLETSPDVYTRLHGHLREVGANVVAVSSSDHDRLVALASHVPHLLAGALMNQAADAAQEDAVLLQLAAGGFRDMTRIAAGDPAIWPDILFENREAVSATLKLLEARLSGLRDALEARDRDSLEASLTSAALARRQLPGRALSFEDMAYLRVLIADRPGSLARVTMTASEMLVNIYDIEIAHSVEGNKGSLLLAVDALQATRFMSALHAQDFEVVREG
ncbi:MAG: prephenate dehydrogenase/arogenate dehydrogenase family protein [Acidimicrobiaceae bacterium]|nr:prephenate dehydrogenase/arogenate dehydrogenase family protein [Acidimicrobiaceae bacterium]